MNLDAIPVLLGGLTVGETVGVRWGWWPLEVYPNGCLTKMRLAPTGPWRHYDLVRLAATIAPRDDHGDELITLVTEEGRELLMYESRLPPGDGRPRGFEPWDLAWTISWWWPREDWRATEALVLRWPARQLRLRLPIDQRGMLAIAGPIVPSSLTEPPP
jgi:hypothetical protein